MPTPDLTRDAVVQAIKEFERLGREGFLKQYGFGPAREYILLYDGKRYDSKAIVGVAHGFARPGNIPLRADQFSGGEATVKPWLEALGFDVAQESVLPLVVGRIYRRQAIHDELKGQRYGGIATPVKHPMVLLFTGEAGHQFGYADGFQSDGTFWYTGEGQTGDMKMQGGNRAIRDHAAEGKHLHLFEEAGAGLVRYLGEASYVGHHVTRAPDREGKKLRDAIVFELAFGEPTTGEAFQQHPATATASEKRLQALSLEELRERALKAPPKHPTPKSYRGWVRRRSGVVKQYVLRRANGVCEGCGLPAPFATPDQQPYLEPHHILRLADKGPDHPRWVVALCPNCHCRVHYGVDGESYNQQLEVLAGRLEAESA